MWMELVGFERGDLRKWVEVRRRSASISSVVLRRDGVT